MSKRERFSPVSNSGTGSKEFDRSEVKRIAKGEQIGVARGRVEGEQAGITKGRAEDRLAIASRMLDKGLDNDLIEEITQLSTAEIERLRHSYNGGVGT